MQLLYALAKLRTPFLDTVLGALTNCGGEIVFMAVAIIVFWCVSKSCGYYMLTVGFVGTIVNQFLKLVFRIPRPWVKDPNFQIVESARAEATGYSFPSGHTQNVFASFGCLGRWTKRTWLRVACAARGGAARTYNKEETTMATRKKTDRAAAEAWLSEPVTVRLFRDNGSYKEDKVVTVNGETVRIPRGEDVIIPRRFALVLAQGEAQDARTGALIERETARFAAESGALGL